MLKDIKLKKTIFKFASILFDFIKGAIYQKEPYSLFKDKNVLVLGPAESNTDYIYAIIKDIDIIVFVNKGYRDIKFYNFLVGKTIILAHCMNQKEDIGGGIIDFERLNSLNIHSIIYPLNELKIHKYFFDFKSCTQAKNINLYQAGYFRSLFLRLELSFFRPNTGYAAIKYITKYHPSSIYLFGFTFMKSNYTADYGTAYNDFNEMNNFIKVHAVHDPVRDLESFVKLYKTNLSIVVSPYMKKVLNLPDRN